MKTIHWYSVVAQSEWQAIEVPSGAKFIKLEELAEQGRSFLRAWAIVDTDNPLVSRDVLVIGTGWEIPEGAQHVDTFVDTYDFAWHLFVRAPYEPIRKSPYDLSAR